MPEKRNIIVIGASAGGFDAIKQLVALLPAGLDAAIFIVWHISPDVRGMMPQVLNRLNTIPASHGVDHEAIRNNHIFIAPPDHHLLIEEGKIRITRGPKENRFRPAVDPLFRSAAYTYGPRVIGLVLSGALDDGTAGLWTVKQRGGIAIVQDPQEAEVPSMPENALKKVDIDYKLPIPEKAKLLTELIAQTVEPLKETDMNEDKKIQAEVSIATEDEAYRFNLLEYGTLTPYTCPDCHGVLSSIQDGKLLRFRCHTGHAFSSDSLLAGITESIEDVLWNAIRNMQESIFLLNHMGDHFAEVNLPKLAAAYFQKAKDAEERSHLVRKAVMNHEQLSQENIAEQSSATDTGSS